MRSAAGPRAEQHDQDGGQCRLRDTGTEQCQGQGELKAKAGKPVSFTLIHFFSLFYST